MSQISYIKYADVLEARRYDAECFVVLNFLKNRYSLKSSTDFSDKNYIEIIDGDRGKNYPNGDDFSSTGYCFFLNTSNVLSGGFNLENGQFISKQKDEILGGGKLKRNDIVFTTRGTIGNVGIYNEFIEYQNIRINSGMVIFRLKNINPSLFFTFLLSTYFKSQIKAYSSGSVQSQIPIQTIKKLKFPILPQSFQLQIEEIVRSANQKQTQSKQLYRKAEKLLLAELGLLDYQVKHSLWFTATKNEVSEAHRYDSEYFQPKYAEIIEKIEKYECGWDFVKNAINFKDKNYTPKDDQKYKYLALSNISSQGYVQDYQEEFGKNLPSRARRKINTNDLIISSIEGSLSSCALVEKEFDNSICSTGFFVLNSEKINSETLLILFKSLVIQELLQRGSKGTILTAISKTELESIKIPLIKPQIQKQIAEKIQESHKLRKESEELLEEAKRKVEEEIEK